MTRILLRGGKDPFAMIPAHHRRAWHGGGFFATNTGNLLFADAVHRQRLGRLDRRAKQQRAVAFDVPAPEGALGRWRRRRG